MCICHSGREQDRVTPSLGRSLTSTRPARLIGFFILNIINGVLLGQPNQIGRIDVAPILDRVGLPLRAVACRLDRTAGIPASAPCCASSLAVLRRPRRSQLLAQDLDHVQEPSGPPRLTSVLFVLPILHSGGESNWERRPDQWGCALTNAVAASTIRSSGCAWQ